jgi:hypothetical protein
MYRRACMFEQMSRSTIDLNDAYSCPYHNFYLKNHWTSKSDLYRLTCKLNSTINSLFFKGLFTRLISQCIFELHFCSI